MDSSCRGPCIIVVRKHLAYLWEKFNRLGVSVRPFPTKIQNLPDGGQKVFVPGSYAHFSHNSPLIETEEESLVNWSIYGAKRYQNADSLMLNAMAAYANS